MFDENSNKRWKDCERNDDIGEKLKTIRLKIKLEGEKLKWWKHIIRMNKTMENLRDAKETTRTNSEVMFEKVWNDNISEILTRKRGIASRETKDIAENKNVWRKLWEDRLQEVLDYDDVQIPFQYYLADSFLKHKIYLSQMDLTKYQHFSYFSPIKI